MIIFLSKFDTGLVYKHTHTHTQNHHTVFMHIKRLCDAKDTQNMDRKSTNNINICGGHDTTKEQSETMNLHWPRFDQKASRGYMVWGGSSADVDRGAGKHTAVGDKHGWQKNARQREWLKESRRQ